MVERHAARRHVAPVLVGSERDGVIPGEGIQSLDFNECDLAINMGLSRVGAEPGGITITLDACSRVQSSLRETLHGCRRERCDVEVQQLTLPIHDALL